MKIKPEKYYGLTDRLSATSASVLMQEGKTPFHFYQNWQRLQQTEKKTFVEGQIYHLSVLEPEEWSSRVAVLDSKNFQQDWRPNKNKEIKALNATKGIYTVLEHEAKKYIEARTAVFNCPEAKALLDNKGGVSEKEASYLWTCEGVKVKSRLDSNKVFTALDSSKYAYISDLKTCEDASDEAIEKAVFDYLLFMQAGTYTMAFEDQTGIAVKGYFLIFLEKKTNLVRVKEIGPDLIELGKEYFRTACRKFKRLKENNLFFQGYEQAVTPITLSDWRMNNLNARIND